MDGWVDGWMDGWMDESVLVASPRKKDRTGQQRQRQRQRQRYGYRRNAHTHTHTHTPQTLTHPNHPAFVDEAAFSTQFPLWYDILDVSVYQLLRHGVVGNGVVGFPPSGCRCLFNGTEACRSIPRHLACDIRVVTARVPALSCHGHDCSGPETAASRSF